MKETQTYYGVFFWLTLVTFIVPLFVAYSAFVQVQPTSKPVPNPDASGVDHDLWDYLIRTYVENGKIDYQAMGRDYLFKVYLNQLASADFDALETDDEKLALYCNAYNAFVAHGVLNHKIQSSVKEFESDGYGFFDLQEYVLANQTYSLNDIEHRIIRPKFQEPRIHMALVCAANGCPAIRPEAYRGDRLKKQLKDQAQLFCNNSKHVFFDEQSQQIMVNSILDWYGSDFDSEGGYLRWIAERTNDTNLQEKLLEAASGQIEYGFIDYDWSLNSLGTNQPYQSSKSEAGSGTIPNE